MASKRRHHAHPSPHRKTRPYRVEEQSEDAVVPPSPVVSQRDRDVVHIAARLVSGMLQQEQALRVSFAETLADLGQDAQGYYECAMLLGAVIYKSGIGTCTLADFQTFLTQTDVCDLVWHFACGHDQSFLEACVERYLVLNCPFLARHQQYAQQKREKRAHKTPGVSSLLPSPQKERQVPAPYANLPTTAVPVPVLSPLRITRRTGPRTGAGAIV